MSCSLSQTNVQQEYSNENYYNQIKSAEEDIASNENYAKKSDFKGFDSDFSTKPLSPVHISQRPLPSVPTGPSTISPKSPKIWDPPARPEDGIIDKEDKKVKKIKTFVLLNFINDNLLFFVLGLLALYLVYGTDFFKGKTNALNIRK